MYNKLQEGVQDCQWKSVHWIQPVQQTTQLPLPSQVSCLYPSSVQIDKLGELK